jgi:hypothetical protein
MEWLYTEFGLVIRVRFPTLPDFLKSYPQKLALTSPTTRGLSIGIVRSWTQATEFSF